MFRNSKTNKRKGKEVNIMCENCFEAAGSPAIINEKTIKASELIEKVYDYEGCGGYAHIVTDDWNLEDESIESCINWALENKNQSDVESQRATFECLFYLLTLTEEERYSAMALHWEIIK
jgi:hypothetical protein